MFVCLVFCCCCCCCSCFEGLNDSFCFVFGIGVVAVLGVFVFSLMLSGLVCSVFCLIGRFCLFWGGLLFCLGYCLFICGGLVICFREFVF